MRHGSDDLLTKRDLKASDKSFPVILQGDCTRVVIAEGALTGLAVQCLSTLRDRPPPSIIITGGINALRWLTESQSLAAGLVIGAKQLLIAGENEIDSDGSVDTVKQARTDVVRDKLVTRLLEIGGQPGRIVYPPAGCRDAAEWLQRLCGLQ
jgi:hypothetical protein